MLSQTPGITHEGAGKIIHTQGNAVVIANTESNPEGAGKIIHTQGNAIVIANTGSNREGPGKILNTQGTAIVVASTWGEIEEPGKQKHTVVIDAEKRASSKPKDTIFGVMDFIVDSNAWIADSRCSRHTIRDTRLLVNSVPERRPVMLYIAAPGHDVF